jgi:serine/threonine protein kinase
LCLSLGGQKCVDPELKGLFTSVRPHRASGGFEELLAEALGTDRVSEHCQNFLKQCLQVNPEARSTAEALRHHPFIRYSICCLLL